MLSVDGDADAAVETRI